MDVFLLFSVSIIYLIIKFEELGKFIEIIGATMFYLTVAMWLLESSEKWPSQKIRIILFRFGTMTYTTLYIIWIVLYLNTSKNMISELFGYSLLLLYNLLLITIESNPQQKVNLRKTPAVRILIWVTILFAGIALAWRVITSLSKVM